MIDGERATTERRATYSDGMTIPTPAERLKHVCAVASLVPRTTPQLIESQSNDTWALDDARLGSVVLRICWRGDVTRMERETAVLQQLPEQVRRPTVVGHGCTRAQGHELSYSLTSRLAGQALEHDWPGLSTAERSSAMRQTASLLRELHRWVPPAELAHELCARPGLAGGTISDLVGADIAPLPIERAVHLAEHVAGMPHVDPALMSAAVQLLRKLADPEPPVDDPQRNVVIHGDLSLSNLLRTPDGTIVLMDFEWTRIAPSSLELLRLCEHADNDMINGTDTHPSVLRLLEAEYPELFQTEDIARRIRLYLLAYSLRALVIAPPDRPADSLPPDHALHRVARLVDGRWPAPGALPKSLVAGG